MSYQEHYLVVCNKSHQDAHILDWSGKQNHECCRAWDWLHEEILRHCGESWAKVSQESIAPGPSAAEPARELDSTTQLCLLNKSHKMQAWDSQLIQ